MGLLSSQWASSNQDIAGPVNDLKVVFDQINDFVLAHGNDVGVVAENLKVLGDTLVDNKAGLAEFMDLAPLMMQNLSSTIGPDRRGRIRLNVSTTLTQFKTLKPLCDQFPMPLCTGAGLTNPISFPISASDPLGIVSAITGGKLPLKEGTDDCACQEDPGHHRGDRGDRRPVELLGRAAGPAARCRRPQLPST